MERKLIVFSKWLSDFKEDCFDSMTEGVIESLIRNAQDSTMNKIGDMLQEILEFSDEQIEEELNN